MRALHGMALLLILAIVPGFSEELPVWELLSRSRIELENGDFGQALILCEKARTVHHQKITESLEVLKAAFSPRDVQQVGDNLHDIYVKLQERNENTALAVLDSIYLTKNSFFFSNSAARLLSWLDKARVLPEADFLEGEIYEAEGETAFALHWYTKAWENRDFFDIPDTRYTLLYRMADLARLTGDYPGAEKYLLLVLSDDPVFGTPDRESPTLTAMKRTLVTEGDVDKFLLLYRHNARFALKAYQDLALLYSDESLFNSNRALSASVLATLISVTWIDKSLQFINHEYTYSTFPAMLREAGNKKNIIELADTYRIWSSFIELSNILERSGKVPQASRLLGYLASDCPDEGIRRIARHMRDGLENR